MDLGAHTLTVPHMCGSRKCIFFCVCVVFFLTPSDKKKNVIEVTKTYKQTKKQHPGIVTSEILT